MIHDDDSPPAPRSTMHIAQLAASWHARMEASRAGHDSTAVGRLAAAYDRSRLTTVCIKSVTGIPVELRRYGAGAP